MTQYPRVPFVPGQYLSQIRIDARGAVVVAGQLAVSAPSDLSERSRQALAKVGTSATRTKAVLKRRTRTPKGMRPVLAAFDTAWSVLNTRLGSLGRLPPEAGDMPARARRLTAALLPDGLSSLQADAESKYVESERMLGVVEEQHLEGELESVAGPGILAEVRRSHAALGEALGLGAAPVPFRPTELSEVLAELLAAISYYALQVTAETDPQSATSVERMHTALAPIERARSDHGSPRSDDTEDVDDTTTTPVALPTPAPTNGVAHS